jgi:hypothetical protein
MVRHHARCAFVVKDDDVLPRPARERAAVRPEPSRPAAATRLVTAAARVPAGRGARSARPARLREFPAADRSAEGLCCIGAVATAGHNATKDNAAATTATSAATTAAATKQSTTGQSTTKPTAAVTTEAVAEATTKPTQAAKPTKEMTVSQENAVEKAGDYLDYSAFSRSGLIKQLKYEGFSTKDATFGVDAQKADWNDQAAKKAKEYLDYDSFSRSGLIGQLKYEGFTTAQATYGVKKVGL